MKKSDIDQLKNNLQLEETIAMPGGIFSYRLSIVSGAIEVAATLNGQSIEIGIPAGIAMDWIGSTETGIYRTIKLPDQDSLSISIEKDFICKDRKEENAMDFFKPAELNHPADSC
ncbi:MAG: hypothetical protein IPG01_04260 [Chitinophagaceae bacterium]|nr:hypothetical protein [Chitinophagaceae bacterium]